MSAYFLFLLEKVEDRELFKEYASLAAAARKDHPYEIIAAYDPHQIMEGDELEAVIMLKFPDAAAARAWYESDEYTAARKLRLRAAAGTAVLIEGRD